MKRFFHCIAILFSIIILAGVGCSKDGFITSPDALLRLSEDTLHFDTVFTTTGSTTQYFKIFNQNDKKLKISSVQLVGGATSFFKMNVDGFSGTTITDIEVEPNDSIYGFVTVKIDPTTANLPFVVRDSIKINYNGNSRWMQLEAYGQNAVFLRNRTVTRDTVWQNNLPIVVLGTLTVNEGRTLTINKGTKVYLHADAPILVNGTLRAVGERFDSTRIRFQGDRIDDPYRDYPGSWPGIYFTTKSINNVMEYCIAKNAYQGVIAQDKATNFNPKLTLNQCIFDNIYDVAIGGSNSSIVATNCLVSNCGYNLFMASGGDYTFNHCTMASYGNSYLDHKNAVVTLSNTNASKQINPLNCTLRNSIVYGEGGIVEDEVNLVKDATAAFAVTFTNVFYKSKKDISANASINAASIKSLSSPQFDSINTGKRYFSWKLKPTSPCKGMAAPPSPTLNLDGNARSTPSDLGCF